MKLRKMKITKTVKKLQLLRTDDEYTTQLQRHISEHMEGINTIDNVEDRYIKFRNALTESAQNSQTEMDDCSYTTFIVQGNIYTLMDNTCTFV